MYKCRIDTYATIDVFTKTFTYEQFCDLQDYQLKTGRQLILPWVIYYDKNQTTTHSSKVFFNNMNIWFNCDKTGKPTKDKDGTIIRWVGGGETWYGPDP